MLQCHNIYIIILIGNVFFFIFFSLGQIIDIGDKAGGLQGLCKGVREMLGVLWFSGERRFAALCKGAEFSLD